MKTNDHTSAPDQIDQLFELWKIRNDTWQTVLRTERTLLELIDDILEEQSRMASERGFWWHIKAAFISLIRRLP